MSEDQEKPLKKYTWDEIKSHQSPPDSVWLVIHNKIYDVTEFMEEVRGLVSGPASASEVLMSCEYLSLSLSTASWRRRGDVGTSRQVYATCIRDLLV